MEQIRHKRYACLDYAGFPAFVDMKYTKNIVVVAVWLVDDPR